MSSSRRPVKDLPPTETLALGSGLSLSPRLKLVLTFFRSDPSVKPIDEWQLKRSLLDFLRDSLSLSVPEEDLLLRKRTDLQKRKRDEPVASGTCYIRDLHFLKKKNSKSGEEEEDREILRRRFLEWKGSVVSRMDGIDLNLEGVKFRLSAEVPLSDDFERLKKSWDDFYALQSSGNRYSSRGIIRRPDTVIVSGVPSRWFAEPRVSSKPSMLVTHTIFSVLGKIRNLNVAGDDDLGKTAEGAKDYIVSGLQSKVWIQFENYEDFCGVMKVLCGRSMLKQGSRLRAEYEVTWDRDGFFRNIQQRTDRNYTQESGSQMQEVTGPLRKEASRFQSHTRFDSDDRHPKRFRDYGT